MAWISTAVEEALGFQTGSGQFGVHAGDEAEGTQVKGDPVSSRRGNF